MNVFWRTTCLLAFVAVHASAEDSLFRTALWHADNGQDKTFLWGPELDWAVASEWSVEARYLQGRFNPGGDVEETSEARISAERHFVGWHIGVGGAAFFVETQLRPGWSWSFPDESAQRNADIYGPILVGGYIFPIGGSAFSLNVDGAWMPLDFGDFDELGYDGSFVDGAVSLEMDCGRVRVEAGLRGVFFKDLPDRVINDEREPREELLGAFARLAVEL